MVRPSGERLARLGAGLAAKELPEIPALDISLRASPEKPEGRPEDLPSS
jgi:hypothetical protein